jgi:hypothetical protein
MFGLAPLAVSGSVGKALISKEELLARAENELLPAIHACQNPVGELHRLHLTLGKAFGHAESIEHKG